MIQVSLWPGNRKLPLRSFAGSMLRNPLAFPFRPATKELRVRPGQDRIPMNPEIRREGHQPVLNLVAYLFELPNLLLGAIGIPNTEIQLASTVIDMTCEEPVEGRHLGIPWITSSVGMTIVAGPREYLLYVCRNLCRRGESFGLNDRRVSKVRSDELYSSEYHDGDDQCDFDDLSQHDGHLYGRQ